MGDVRNEQFISVFGANLKKVRLKKGLSQVHLANGADISRSQIGRIERGKINTTISTVYALAKSLDVSVDVLFEWQQ